ncbi:hypothetical protein MPSEU_001098300 [Mayamaea pseudoterrestris]|nr:hypothetical protein MPSEU_001098300 [Mayamaea pseudoterrestris]
MSRNESFHATLIKHLLVSQKSNNNDEPCLESGEFGANVKKIRRDRGAPLDSSLSTKRNPSLATMGPTSTSSAPDATSKSSSKIIVASVAKPKNTPLPISASSIFWTKETYAHVAADFHAFHKHDLNVLAHLFTTTLGVWGMMQLAVEYNCTAAVHAYGLLVLLTTPIRTALLHSILLYGMLPVNANHMGSLLSNFLQSYTPLQAPDSFSPIHVCLAAIALGYGLQDLAHYLACEQTYMNFYMAASKQYMLVIHSLWLLPLVIDSILMKSLLLPKLLVTRNRCLVVPMVASKQAVDALRTWINVNVKPTKETTHLWPHEHAGTDLAVTQLEHDAAIQAAFEQIFAPHHYSIKPVIDMNEIYVTAVGPKTQINSDAVFYTPHTDGPYWWLPGCSLYRVLVGVTPNKKVRTRFNLQHSSCDQALDLHGALGFDYNRELHWIDHVPNTHNSERRSLVKLHYIVYPFGWHKYGRLAAHLNASYNTWARNNFLKTLRPATVSDHLLAWWIWLTTWVNAMFEEHIGWANLTYVLASYALLPPLGFLIATSFRHYAVYIATFASRQPAVAHGYLMRDAKLYKTISMLHLARRFSPLVVLPRDVPALLIASLGFATTLLATARLGMVRTYFGSELGFVPPKWINGFPYGYIPHPMINGQIFGFGVLLWWFWNDLSTENVALMLAHIGCYATHMFQEIVFG